MALMKYQVAGAGDVKSYHMGANAALAEGAVRQADNAPDAVRWLLDESVLPLAEQKVRYRECVKVTPALLMPSTLQVLL
jgi:hypothetical protein